MKNVLIISATDTIGGAEIVLYDFLKENRFHNFYILTSNNKMIEKGYKDVLGDKVFCSKVLSGYNFKGNPILTFYRLIFALLEIKKIVKEFSIDILYGNNTKDFVILVFYKIFIDPKIKTVAHIHDMLTEKIHRVFLHNFASKIDLFITPSKACAEKLIGADVDKNKIKCIYNGIQYSTKYIRNYYDKKHIINIFFIGSIFRLKRPDIFIDVLNILNELSSITFNGYIIGPVLEKSCFEETEKKIKCAKNKGIIKYLGSIPHKKLLSDIYPNIDILFLSSDKDTLPTVILEAMSFGKVVVARNVDGVPEMISDGIDGIIFKYTATPNEIAEKILFYIADNDFLNDISYAAYLKIREKFSNNIKKEKINWLIENNCF